MNPGNTSLIFDDNLNTNTHKYITKNEDEIRVIINLKL